MSHHPGPLLRTRDAAVAAPIRETHPSMPESKPTNEDPTMKHRIAPTPAPAPRRAAALTTLLLAGGLLLASLSAGCGGDHEAAEAEVERTTVSGTLQQAELVQVSRSVDLYGTVAADKTAAVSSRAMAQVTDVRVSAGDFVHEGEVLLEIDPQAARGQVGQAQGGLAQARAALALAERNYERYKNLVEADAASELELDMARMEYERAKGAVEQAESAVSAASSVASDTTVRAPFAGRVVRRMVEEGDLAAPGRPLLMLESESARRAVVHVPESVVASTGLSIGDTLGVRLDSRPELGVLRGEVVEMSPGADPMSHAYEVRVDLPVDQGIPTGGAVRASVPVGDREAVAIPAEALLTRGGLDLVVVLTDEGYTASRAVTVGQPMPDGRLEILSGLKGGETVVLGLAEVPPAGSEVAGAEPSRPNPRTEG